MTMAHLVVSIFGAMFAPKPFDVAKDPAWRSDRYGELDSNDPTLVAQLTSALQRKPDPRIQPKMPSVPMI